MEGNDHQSIGRPATQWVDDDRQCTWLNRKEMVIGSQMTTVPTRHQWCSHDEVTSRLESTSEKTAIYQADQIYVNNTTYSSAAITYHLRGQ